MTRKFDFVTCPHCAGYGVRDSGANCRTCGGVGRGGLNSPPGACIGSGELIVDAETRATVSRAEFLKAVGAGDRTQKELEL